MTVRELIKKLQEIEDTRLVIVDENPFLEDSHYLKEVAFPGNTEWGPVVLVPGDSVDWSNPRF